MRFQIERWAPFIEEGKEIFPVHFEELALDKEQMPLGMDFAFYQKLEDLGFLHVLTAREGKKLVGYYIAMVFQSHPHNKDAGPVSTTDMFYILPAYRKGGAGAKLLMMAEKTLRERGVKKAAISVKVHQNHGTLLKALGWKETDIVFHKLL
jgi:GNAT superfamily N-acetyltransferase